MAISLGQVQFGLGVDTRRLQAGTNRILAFGRTVAQVTQRQQQYSAGVISALNRQEAAAVRGLQAVVKANDQIRRSTAGNQQQQLLDRTTKAFDRFSRSMTQSVQTQLGFQRANQILASSLGQVRRQVQAVTEAEARRRRVEASLSRGFQSSVNVRSQIRRNVGGPEQVRLLQQVANAYRRYRTQLAAGNGDLNASTRANQVFSASLNKVKVQLAKVREAQSKAKRGQTDFGELLRDLASASVLAVGPLSGLGARIAALGAVAHRSGLLFAGLIGGVVGVSVAFAKLASGAVKTALNIQRIESRLKSTTGSVDFANVEFKRLRELAHDTGLEFVTLATQFTRFQAAAQGTALEGGRAREVFDNIAFAVGNFQLEAVQAEGVFRAVEQIMSKGTVAAEEIRQQLGDRLPGAFKAAADAVGVTTAEFNKLLKTGKVAADKFLLPFSRQVRARLAGDAGDAVDSLRASLNRLTNSTTFFNDSFDNAFGISKAFKAGVETLTSVINFFGRNVLTVAGILGGLAGGFAIIALPRVIAGFVSLTAAVKGAAFAFVGLNVAVAANPFSAVLTVAVRLLAILGGAAIAMATFGTSTAEAATKEAEMELKTKALIESQEQLNTTVSESASIFKKAAIAKLESIKLELQGQQQQLSAYKAVLTEQLKQNSALAIMHKNSQEFISAMRSASGDMTSPGDVGTGVESAFKQRIVELNKALKEQEERIRKLDEIKNKPFTNPLNEGLDRAGKAAREASQAIDILLQKNQAMMQGPQAFELLERQIDVNKKIQDFKDRLVDAQVPLADIRKLVDQYTFALQYNEEISNTTFKNMVATYETFKGIAVSSMQSVADSFADAIVEGKLGADTFVDVFKSMVKKIIAETLKLAIINPILNSIFGSVGGSALPTFDIGAFGFAQGAAFSQGNVLKSPTAFMTKQGLSVAGEAGPEAVMPLVRGSQGLGIRAYTSADGSVSTNASAGGGDRISNVYVTFQTPDARSFMQSQSQISAVLASAVQQGHRNL